MKRFPSKIGVELIVPLILILGGMLIWMLYDEDWLDSVFMVLIILFIIYTFLTTYYQIEENVLRVKCGFFVDKSIDIKSIRKIIETRNPAGAPAASLDRLELIYQQTEAILVSPKAKNQFIDELLKIQPDIEVRVKR